MFSPLPSGRVTTTRTPNGICIAIRPQRGWQAAFIAIWLVAWTVMPWKIVMAALQSLRDPPTAQWFGLLWSVGWICGIVFASSTLGWMIGGLETIQIAPTELMLTKSVFHRPIRTWTMKTADVRNLRFSPAYGSGKRRVASRIAFEYGIKTIGLGAALEDGEALAIIDSMLEVYAFPKRDRSLEFMGL